MSKLFNRNLLNMWFLRIVFNLLFVIIVKKFYERYDFSLIFNRQMFDILDRDITFAHGIKNGFVVKIIYN